MRKILQVALKNDENFCFMVGKKGFLQAQSRMAPPIDLKQRGCAILSTDVNNITQPLFGFAFFKLSVFTAGPSKYP